MRRVIHNDDKKPFYEFFTNYCGYLFSGIIYLIVILRMKKNESSTPDIKKNKSFLEPKEPPSIESIQSTIPTSKTQNFDNQIMVEKNKKNFKYTKRKYCHILALAFIYLIPMFLDSYCSSNKDISFKTSSSMSLFFCIISYVALSRIILGIKIYRHQIFSLVIIIVCNIMSVTLMLLGEDKSNIVINIILMFVILFLYALFNILEKRYFNKYMDSPYHLMFVIGFISLIIILLYETITFFVFGKNEDFNGIFYQIELNIQNNKFYPLLFIGDVLSAFLWVAGIHLTVYFFTPCHFIISESFSQILSTFINDSLKDHSPYIRAIIYTLFCIIFIAALIYNEVIIINACSFEIDTRKHIQKRAKIENDNIFYEEENGRKDTLSDVSDF